MTVLISTMVGSNSMINLVLISSFPGPGSSLRLHGCCKAILKHTKVTVVIDQSVNAPTIGIIVSDHKPAKNQCRNSEKESPPGNLCRAYTKRGAPCIRAIHTYIQTSLVPDSLALSFARYPYDKAKLEGVWTHPFSSTSLNGSR